MAQLIEAIYEQGSFRPLQSPDLAEGQRVTLAVEPMAMTTAEAEAVLSAWHAVYEGLSDEEISEVEAIALDRSNFARGRDEESPDA